VELFLKRGVGKMIYLVWNVRKNDSIISIFWGTKREEEKI